MKKLILCLLVVASFVSSALAYSDRPAQLSPFTSDGCSNWPEGPRGNRNLWRECCFVHDISYWMGGPRAERLKADRELSSCVKSKGAGLNSILMYIGVRIGGGPHRMTSYRWGYGWNQLRGFRSLSASERAAVVEELDVAQFTSAEAAWVARFRAENDI